MTSVVSIPLCLLQLCLDSSWQAARSWEACGCRWLWLSCSSGSQLKESRICSTQECFWDWTHYVSVILSFKLIKILNIFLDLMYKCMNPALYICFQWICERSWTRWQGQFALVRLTCHCENWAMGWKRWRNNWGGWVFSWRTYGRWWCFNKGWIVIRVKQDIIEEVKLEILGDFEVIGNMSAYDRVIVSMI